MESFKASRSVGSAKLSARTKRREGDLETEPSSTTTAPAPHSTESCSRFIRSIAAVFAFRWSTAFRVSAYIPRIPVSTDAWHSTRPVSNSALFPGRWEHQYSRPIQVWANRPSRRSPSPGHDAGGLAGSTRNSPWDRGTGRQDGSSPIQGLSPFFPVPLQVSIRRRPSFRNITSIFQNPA